MCTYITETTPIAGAAKGPKGWVTVDTANVYYDHPQAAPYDHTLNIDFVNQREGAPVRVAVELTAESALALIEKIQAALEAGRREHAL
ncbi:MAG TPA: DUF6295 family protein [Dehalococcoidia bacterium]|nr:DUF6295 family protein [Dehalococcoidia bacterium]